MSYYGVKRGRIPGIYNSWKECELQVKGFSDAKFKKFNTIEEAEEYLNQVEDIQNEQPTEGLAVDASLIKDNVGEYQIFDIKTQKIIYNSGIYQNTTVNIMEFLAIACAILIIDSNENFKDYSIYSDSATALTWIRNKEIKTNNSPDPNTLNELRAAIEYIKVRPGNIPVKKWNTKVLKDIPADFKRK